MRISYKREMRHNYLIVEPDTPVNGCFESRMLLGNMIDGLLKFHMKLVDERQLYYYEITSKQPLDRVLEQHAITARQIRTLIAGIDHALNHLELYLLSEDQILLEPQYIYVEPESFAVSLCLVPGKEGCFSEQLTRLLQYLLGKVNHQEQESVVLAYGLYQESLKENYGMEDLLKWLNREGEQELREECDAFEPVLDHEGAGFDEPERYVEKSVFMREQEEKIMPENLGWKWMAGILLLTIAGWPAAVWLLWGGRVLMRNYIWFAGLDVVVSIALLFFSHRQKILCQGEKDSFKNLETGAVREDEIAAGSSRPLRMSYTAAVGGEYAAGRGRAAAGECAAGRGRANGGKRVAGVECAAGREHAAGAERAASQGRTAGAERAASQGRTAGAERAASQGRAAGAERAASQGRTAGMECAAGRRHAVGMEHTAGRGCAVGMERAVGQEKASAREMADRLAVFMGGRRRAEEMDWNMVFGEEQGAETAENTKETMRAEAASAPGDHDADTVLLADFGPEPGAHREIRRLVSIDKSKPDIQISYYPFIIGKQDGLVDYILDENTVSRIHMRIDRFGEQYSVTDLNSTNGTYIRGKLLETNETVPLSTGDEVTIANIGYIFT